MKSKSSKSVTSTLSNIDEEAEDFVLEKADKNLSVNDKSTVTCKNKKAYIFPKSISSTRPECFVVRFDKQDKYLAGGFSSGHILLYDLEKQSLEKFMSTSEYPITNLRWKTTIGKSILISVHADGRIAQWFPTQGKILYELQEKDNIIMALDYHRAGTLFATAGSDNKVRIYDDETKTLAIQMEKDLKNIEHSNRIFSVCFHKTKGDLLVSGGWDNTVKFFDIREKKIIGSIYGPHVVGDSLDLRENYLLTGSASIKDQLQIWDIRTYKLVETIELSTDQKQIVSNINCAQFSKCNSKFGQTFAVGGLKKNQLRVFSDNPPEFHSNGLFQKWHPLVEMDNLSVPIYSLDYMHSQNSLAYSFGKGVIVQMDLATKTL